MLCGAPHESSKVMGVGMGGGERSGATPGKRFVSFSGLCVSLLSSMRACVRSGREVVMKSVATQDPPIFYLSPDSAMIF